MTGYQKICNIFCHLQDTEIKLKQCSIFIDILAFVIVFAIAGILVIVIVLVNIDLQQVNRSLYSYFIYSFFRPLIKVEV